MEFSEILNINLFENMHEISEQFVITLLDQLGLDYSQMEIHNLIDEWVFGSTDDLPFSITLKQKKLASNPTQPKFFEKFQNYFHLLILDLFFENILFAYCCVSC